MEQIISEKGKEVRVPEWFKKYSDNLRGKKVDPLVEVNNLANMKLDQLKKHMGGNINELPYELLQTLFIDGSDSAEVADVLKLKRKEYLLNHPEKQMARGASEGIITYDGRFISKEVWNTASDSEKRGALVGSTCFHYNSDTPGMGSSPKDRW